MDNTNKPQWLIDAENEINQFAETKLGKMSQEEFKFFERQSNAGKAGVAKLREQGYYDSESFKDTLKKAVTNSVASRKESGYFKSDTHIASMQSRADAGNKAYQEKYKGTPEWTEWASKRGKASWEILSEDERKERVDKFVKAGGKASGIKRTLIAYNKKVKILTDFNKKQFTSKELAEYTKSIGLGASIGGKICGDRNFTDIVHTGYRNIYKPVNFETNED